MKADFMPLNDYYGISVYRNLQELADVSLSDVLSANTFNAEEIAEMVAEGVKRGFKADAQAMAVAKMLVVNYKLKQENCDKAKLYDEYNDIVKQLTQKHPSSIPDCQCANLIDFKVDSNAFGGNNYFIPEPKELTAYREQLPIEERIKREAENNKAIERRKFIREEMRKVLSEYPRVDSDKSILLANSPCEECGGVITFISAGKVDVRNNNIVMDISERIGDLVF